ncbi:hypothetical protein POM88_010662 [Heracleum sosnowskyi]|uniref:Uncharacterized protein n=1 Tax=Heracleum sosnowskyi TaxID=360622 RepID=A0AAD8N0I4_9APIA|nr:hypothetical protein POM88_010662 [Heracleum sosnowskyi]
MSNTVVAPMNSNTISVSSSGRFLFMFIRRDIGLYVLYKIDATGLYRSLKTEDNLRPLIVFEPDLLPDCDCAFAYIEPYFYIVGQNKRDVFTLNKNRLLKLVPTNNHRGRKFVTRIQPMNLDKLAPLAFAYESKLYVLSKTCANAPYRFITHYDFELYSPDDGSWIGLEPLRSSYIVTMDISEEIVCVVCYGGDPSSDGVSYDARLSFFKVAEGYHPSCSTPVEGQTCARLFSSLLEEEGKCANNFKLDCVHHTLLRIPTKQKFTRGIISSCSVV